MISNLLIMSIETDSSDARVEFHDVGSKEAHLI